MRSGFAGPAMPTDRTHPTLGTDREPPLTAFHRDVLYAIQMLEKPSGRDIRDALEADAVYDEVNHGRMYPNLDELVSLGLLRKGMQNKRSNWYALSPCGEAVIEELDSRKTHLQGVIEAAEAEGTAEAGAGIGVE